jgi:ATP-dependent RNA helicase RhlE
MTFANFHLDPSLQRGIADLGFNEPTPIQLSAIPPALAGRDVLACAMTGSGKTAAFVLPLLQRLTGHRNRFTRALIITPTRELASQVNEHLRELARYTCITSTTVFGGVKSGPQERALRAGVDVVVATPGRLLDHMQHPWACFDRLEVLVLDEADRMLDMGFLPDIRRILARLPEARQTMLFSATIPRPIAQLSKDLLVDPVHLDIERPAAPATGVEQAVLPVPEKLKRILLLDMLQRDEVRTALVFTRTKHRANRLSDFLSRAGITCDRIHGNRSQPQREKALAGFKHGHLRVLVATDVAARGIDVVALPYVINFDVPAQPDDYIHRVGRTARARTTGQALTFASPEETSKLTAIERALGKKLVRRRLQGFDYQADPGGRFEVPIGERIAELRARRAAERARAAEKRARCASQAPVARPAESRQRENGSSGSDSAPRTRSRRRRSRRNRHRRSAS